MTESRNRARKVTRKAGPPETESTAASPVFQAPSAETNGNGAPAEQKKTDTDNSSSISVSELKHMLLENGIKLDRQFQTMPTFERKESETFNRISP